jgi:hypothetical protein
MTGRRMGGDQLCPESKDVECSRSRRLLTHFPIRQSVDYDTERTQTLVDLLRLLERLTGRSRLADLLRTSQIDEVEISVLGLARLDVLLGNGDDEDGVGSRRFGVHVCQS